MIHYFCERKIDKNNVHNEYLYYRNTSKIQNSEENEDENDKNMAGIIYTRVHFSMC